MTVKANISVLLETTDSRLRANMLDYVMVWLHHACLVRHRILCVGKYLS
jgi:hypothetical protein